MEFPGFPPLAGSGVACAFATLDSLAAFYARYLPAGYVRNLIEAEKEIFVVRRECTLEETHAQFLRKCEGALRRSLEEARDGRAGWDWSWAPPANPIGQAH